MAIYNDVIALEEAIEKVLTPDEYGDVNEEALQTLIDVKKTTIADGLERLCKVRTNKIARIEGLKAEIKRMTEQIKSEENQLQHLENYMFSIYKMSGEKKVSAGSFIVSTRQSASVYTVPEFDVPEFMRTQTISDPDKVAIKDALKNGKDVPGAYLTIKEKLSVK